MKLPSQENNVKGNQTRSGQLRSSPCIDWPKSAPKLFVSHRSSEQVSPRLTIVCDNAGQHREAVEDKNRLLPSVSLSERAVWCPCVVTRLFLRFHIPDIAIHRLLKELQMYIKEKQQLDQKQEALVGQSNADQYEARKLVSAGPLCEMPIACGPAHRLPEGHSHDV